MLEVAETNTEQVEWNKDLKKPSDEFIQECIFKFNNDIRFSLPEQAIKNLISAFPENKKIEDILLKVSVINALYSANIFNTFRMAEHILQLQVDLALIKGDTKVVNMIATGHGIKTKKRNIEINFYSFATKYCNWHNSGCYALYDNFVEKILLAYQCQDRFSDFKKSDLKDFTKFLKIIYDFMNFYGLTRYNLKEIDKFFWIYGKEKFPNNYGKLSYN